MELELTHQELKDIQYFINKPEHKIAQKLMTRVAVKLLRAIEESEKAEKSSGTID